MGKCALAVCNKHGKCSIRIKLLFDDNIYGSSLTITIVIVLACTLYATMV